MSNESSAEEELDQVDSAVDGASARRYVRAADGREGGRPRSFPGADRRRRFTRWRLTSPLCAALDGLVGVAGLALTAVALLDSVYSWWGNTVLVSPSVVERLAEILLIPSWPWMALSLAAVVRNRRGRQRWRIIGSIWPRAARVAVGVLALAVLVVVVGGFAIGGAKGSVRVLPVGGIHQVSTYDLNSSNWTTVSPRAYKRWEARFVREDGVFGLFSVLMVGFAAKMHYLRVRLRHFSSAPEAFD